MKKTLLILAILLTSPSIYAGSCFEEPYDYKDCRIKAEQGSTIAQTLLGFMYANGRGVPQDYKQAVKWYRKAAEQGDFDAQYNLGFMCANGRGVPQDDKQAVKWYRKAAEQGHAFAQYNLGGMYARGVGVAQDYVMAHMLWNIAAASGDKDAAENRVIVAEMMTSDQIEKAQDLARKWVREHP